MSKAYHIPAARYRPRVDALEDLRLKRDASEDRELAGYADRGETDALRDSITLDLRRRWERDET